MLVEKQFWFSFVEGILISWTVILPLLLKKTEVDALPPRYWTFSPENKAVRHYAFRNQNAMPLDQYSDEDYLDLLRATFGKSKDDLHLTEPVKFTCPLHDEDDYLDLEKYQEHAKTHTLPHVCSSCDTIIGTVATFNKHMKKHEKGFLQCPACAKTFGHMRLLRRHYLETPEHVRDAMNELYRRDTKARTCPFCSTNFKRCNEYQRHLGVHLFDQLKKCSTCHHRFSSTHSLSRHQKDCKVKKKLHSENEQDGSNVDDVDDTKDENDQDSKKDSKSEDEQMEDDEQSEGDEDEQMGDDELEEAVSSQAMWNDFIRFRNGICGCGHVCRSFPEYLSHSISCGRRIFQV